MKRAILTLLCLSFSFVVLAQNSSQNPPPSPVQRQVRDRTIVSDDLPAADLTLSAEFRYIGAQVITLYGIAEAEQHLFVKTNESGSVDAFCWVQFEHRLPNDKHTYDYKLSGATDIGGLSFVYDVKSFLNYDDWDPGSDGIAILSLLGKSHFSFPRPMARVRMFHLPSPDRRSELMIIYGEALPPDSKIPVSIDGIPLDQAAPDFANLLLAHVKQSLTIRKH